MLTRQKIILNLIDRAAGRMSRLQLVKLAFLFANEHPFRQMESFYRFLPYRYGPFSFTLYHELDTAIRHGHLVELPGHELALCPDLDPDLYRVQTALGMDIDRLWSRYETYSTSALLDEVYERFPWFTLNSDKPECRRVYRPCAAPAVYTAGYQSLQVDGFLNSLLRAGICQVVDVRKNPVSRQYGFHKSTLAGLCQRLDIRYEHVPDLGIPSKWRLHVSRQDDYARLFDRYENEILISCGEIVEKIAGWMKEVPSVLVCYEADPNRCHRLRLATAVSKVSGLPVLNMGAETWVKDTKRPEYSSPL